MDATRVTARRTTTAPVVGTLLMLVAVVWPAATPAASASDVAELRQDTLAELIEQLPVADEQREGYDRDRLLQHSLTEHDCYYSRADCQPTGHPRPPATPAFGGAATADSTTGELASDTDADGEEMSGFALAMTLVCLLATAAGAITLAIVQYRRLRRGPG